MKNIKSILDLLSIEHLKILKEDVKKIYNNKHIFYVTDTFDIVNYSLPFLDKNFIRDIEKDIMPQSFVMYEAIFNDNQNFNFTLPDEYINEIRNVRKSIDYKLQYSFNIRKSLLDIDENDIKGMIEKNIQKIIAILLIISLENKLYVKFDGFLKKNLNIETFKHSNENTKDIVNKTFLKVNPSDLSKKIFNKFVEENKFQLYSLENDFKRYVYLENTYKDIKVIDRIYNINKELNKHNIYFNYLSSAPYKTTQIFNSLKEVTKGYNSFNRNIYQLFILNYIFDEKETNNLEKNIACKYIDLLVAIKENKHTSIEELTSGDYLYQIFISHNKVISNYQKMFENNMFLKEYNSIKTKVESLLNNNSSDRTKLQQIISELNKYNDEYSNKRVVNDIETFNSAYKLSNRFFSKNTSNIILHLHSGKDVINNSFHHLPIIPFLYYTKNNSVLIKSFYKLVNSISNKPEMIGNNYPLTEYNLLIEVINNISNTTSLPTIEEQSMSHVILSFLNIITKNISNNKSEGNSIQSDEAFIMSELEHYKNIIENTHFNVQIKDSKLEVNYSGDEIVINEIVYILLNLYRRNKRYEKAIELINKQTKNEDARYFHSIGLIYNSLFYSNYNKDTDLKQVNYQFKYFDDAIKNLETAKQKYLELLLNKKINYVEQYSLVIKQIVAINNSIIDLKIRKNLEKKDEISQNVLSKLRDLLKEIKCYINRLNLEISDYKTINHTEAELEYYEALYLYKLEKFNAALYKINKSTERIMLFDSSGILVPDNFKSDIISKVNILKMDIYKKLKYI